MQWCQLGALRFDEIFPDISINEITSIQMWTKLKGLSNAVGEFKFKELSDFAIKT